MKIKKLPDSKNLKRLVSLLQRNGCFRSPHQKLRKKLGQQYKKGWEVRFILNSGKELSEVRRLLKGLDIQGGSAYKKRSQWVQPIYGKDAVGRFSTFLKPMMK